MPVMTNAPVCHADVTGLILAGGQGRRFGGADKGLALHRGRPLAAHQLALLTGRVTQVLISANRHLADYRSMGVEVVSDTVPDWPGPLAGMSAAAHAARTPWLVCVPCDVLNLPDDTVTRLLAAAGYAGAPAAYAQAVDGPHYALCALRTTLAGALDAALAGGRHAVRDFLRAQHAAMADFSDCALVNANRPELLS